MLGVGTVLGIVVLSIYRQVANPARLGRASRFYGSHMGRAYFVEAIVFVEGAGILLVRAAKHAIGGAGRAGVVGSRVDGDRVAAAGRAGAGRACSPR